ncbi:uncharacterized protein RJT21DRAFT_117040 [Scheffersomyces amazonensis]|uniref:uncharacterized protein n=1 Tax=Scheffersomyces amazonensis TaxID=1078765 RepID=UPI00315DD63D
MLDMEKERLPYHINISGISGPNPSASMTTTDKSTSTSRSSSNASTIMTRTNSSSFSDCLVRTPPTPYYYSTSLPNNINETYNDDYFSIIKPKLSISTVSSIASYNSNNDGTDTFQLNSPPLDYSSNTEDEDKSHQEYEQTAVTDHTSICSDSYLLSNNRFTNIRSMPEPCQVISPVEEPESKNIALTLASSASSSSSSLSSNATYKVNLTPFKFLIVDDNVINIKILERILSKLYPKSSVKSLQDSTKVMQYLNNHEVDMLFLDIEMPEVTGIDIACSLRHTHRHSHSHMASKPHKIHHNNTKNFKDMGIIAVTTRSLPEDLELYSEIGIDHTFSKPLGYKYDYFSNTIDKIIELRQG